MNDHMKVVAKRMAATIEKKGTAYAMKYLIHCCGWSEDEAEQIVKYAKEKPPEKADGISKKVLSFDNSITD